MGSPGIDGIDGQDLFSERCRLLEGTALRSGLHGRQQDPRFLRKGGQGLVHALVPLSRPDPPGQPDDLDPGVHVSRIMVQAANQTFMDLADKQHSIGLRQQFGHEPEDQGRFQGITGITGIQTVQVFIPEIDRHIERPFRLGGQGGKAKFLVLAHPAQTRQDIKNLDSAMGQKPLQQRLSGRSRQTGAMLADSLVQPIAIPGGPGKRLQKPALAGTQTERIGKGRLFIGRTFFPEGKDLSRVKGQGSAYSGNRGVRRISGNFFKRDISPGRIMVEQKTAAEQETKIPVGGTKRNLLQGGPGFPRMPVAVRS